MYEAFVHVSIGNPN